MSTHSTIDFRETFVPRLTPLACRKCGVIDQPSIGPGKGPHRAAAVCRHCGMHLHWLSAYSPAERQARRQAARAEAMARKPPSLMQLAYLTALGHVGPAPVTMLEASTLLDSLLQKSQAPDNRIEDSVP